MNINNGDVVYIQYCSHPDWGNGCEKALVIKIPSEQGEHFWFSSLDEDVADTVFSINPLSPMFHGIVKAEIERGKP